MRLFEWKRSRLELCAPAAGELVTMAKVPDPAFSRGLLGVGFAVLPSNNQVCSPISGVVRNVFETKHAFVIESSSISVLVHAGLDTVSLNGQHLTAVVAQGDSIAAGEPLLRWDVETISSLGYGTHVVVCLVDQPAAEIELLVRGAVTPGQIVAHARLNGH